ncbi:MAG: hypothetical protein R6U38_06055 [Desulfatiglandaceae bacterium]
MTADYPSIFGKLDCLSTSVTYICSKECAKVFDVTCKAPNLLEIKINPMIITLREFFKNDEVMSESFTKCKPLHSADHDFSLDMPRGGSLSSGIIEAFGRSGENSSAEKPGLDL